MWIKASSAINDRKKLIFGGYRAVGFEGEGAADLEASSSLQLMLGFLISLDGLSLSL